MASEAITLLIFAAIVGMAVSYGLGYMTCNFMSGPSGKSDCGRKDHRKDHRKGEDVPTGFMLTPGGQGKPTPLNIKCHLGGRYDMASEFGEPLMLFFYITSTDEVAACCATINTEVQYTEANQAVRGRVLLWRIAADTMPELEEQLAVAFENNLLGARGYGDAVRTVCKMAVPGAKKSYEKYLAEQKEPA